MRAQPRRQLLIDTACRLFNEQGYHATGIDLILGTSGVSKATLYKYFRSKDELILEVLAQRHEQVFSLMQKAFSEAKESGAKHPVLCLFDLLDTLINSENFYGCNFINACSEFAEETDNIHQYAALHKKKVQALLIEYLVGTDEQKKREQSEALILLMDGAIVNAHVLGNKNAAKTALSAARKLLG